MDNDLLRVLYQVKNLTEEDMFDIIRQWDVTADSRAFIEDENARLRFYDAQYDGKTFTFKIEYEPRGER